MYVASRTGPSGTSLLSGNWDHAPRNAPRSENHGSVTIDVAPLVIETEACPLKVMAQSSACGSQLTSHRHDPGCPGKPVARVEDGGGSRQPVGVGVGVDGVRDHEVPLAVG